MKNLIRHLIICYFIFFGISYSSDFNYDTGLALISKNAHKATITSMDQYENRIYALGVHGIILYSDDNGEKWIQSELVPFNNTLTDIECVSKSQCWAIGHDAIILHTTDAGLTWSKQYADPDFDAPLLSIYMKDYLNGIAIGAFTYGVKTNDGGETWERFMLSDDPFEPHLNSIYSGNSKSDIETIYVAAELGQVHSSVDQGLTWTVVDTGYFGSLWGGIEVNDHQSLLLGMSGKVFILSNSSEEFKVETINVGIKNSLTDIKFLDVGKYIISGNGGVVSIIDLENETIETCIRGDRRSNTSILEIEKDKYLLGGEDGFRFHSMRECQSHFKDLTSISKDIWMKNEFQYETWSANEW